MFQFCHRKLAMSNLKYQSFKMFSDNWDVQLEISVVSTHVNLNALSVYAKKKENGKSVSTLVFIDSPQ